MNLRQKSISDGGLTVGNKGVVAFPIDIEEAAKEAKVKAVQSLPEKIDWKKWHPEKYVEITYDPSTVHCGCGKVYASRDFAKRSETIVAINNLKIRAENNLKINQLVELLKAGKVDAYTFWFEHEKIIALEQRDGIDTSNYSGSAEMQCECNNILKAEVKARVTVDCITYYPTNEDYRKLPLPNKKVISHLIRSGEVFIPAETSDKQHGWDKIKTLEGEIKKLKKEGKSNEQKEKQYAEELKWAKETSVNEAYVLELLEKPPEVKSLIEETKQKFRSKNIRPELLSTLETALDMFAELVQKTYDSDCAKFVNAIFRLAQRDAYLAVGV